MKKRRRDWFTCVEEPSFSTDFLSLVSAKSVVASAI